jgi:hypothetical protein
MKKITRSVAGDAVVFTPSRTSLNYVIVHVVADSRSLVVLAVRADNAILESEYASGYYFDNEHGRLYRYLRYAAT